MGYVYEIENMITGKKYIGKTSKDIALRIRQHVTRVNCGNGSILHDAIRKYGLSSFRARAWEVTDSNASLAEITLIRLFNTVAPGGYNVTLGGEGSSGVRQSIASRLRRSVSSMGSNNPNYGKHHTAEAKEKMSIKKKGIYAKERHPMFGVCRLGELGPFYGKHHTEETKKRISDAAKGRVSWNSGKTGPDSPMYGRKHSVESKNKMSEARRAWYLKNKSPEVT